VIVSTPAVLAFLVLAAPAAAKGPVFNQFGCNPTVGKGSAPPAPHIRALCQRRQATSDRHGFNGAAAGIVAGSVGVLVLMMAGGMLVATHRRDGQQAPQVS
jgi:hypothetical protein